MPSAALQIWMTERTDALREVQDAHASVGGTERGRRYATQQINHAYVMLLSGQFQGFYRDLHTECIDHLVGLIPSSSLQAIFLAEVRRDRKLDRGNPSPGNIGSDFNRLGLKFWDEVKALNRRNLERQQKLEELNAWRNAIAHQDFNPASLAGRSRVQLAEVRRWHTACDALAQAADSVMQRHLTQFLGAPPW